MPLDKRTREQLLAHCEQIGPDDGIDPRTYFKQDSTHRRQNRKALQLCRQVEGILQHVGTGEGSDSLLNHLHVQSVTPSPDSSRLLVTYAADLPPEQFDRQQLLLLLQNQAKRLRYEVAQSITRKRAPVLVFHVVGPEQSRGD